MKFEKELLQRIVEDREQDYEIMKKEIVDQSRWSTYETVVFKDLTTGKFYETTYSYGSTECQDESPYEYEDDEIEVDEVEPRQVTVTQYFKI